MVVRRVGNRFRVVSRTGRNLGTFDTRAEAERRDRQVMRFREAATGRSPSRSSGRRGSGRGSGGGRRRGRRS